MILSAICTLILSILITCFDKVIFKLYLVFKISTYKLYMFIIIYIIWINNSIVYLWINRSKYRINGCDNGIRNSNFFNSLFNNYKKRFYNVWWSFIYHIVFNILIRIIVFISLIFVSFSKNSLISIIMSSIVVILFGFYLIYDT